MLNQAVFRERDICGIADTDFSDADIEILGKALASYLIRYSGRIISIGRDSRPSSERLHAALLKGLTAAGTHAIDIGVVPPPVLFYSVFDLSADGAIMITGGDESPDHNGFRIVCGTSLLPGRALEDIYKVMTTGDFEAEEGNVRQLDACGPYIDQLALQFQFDRALKVHLDAGSTTLPVLERLLKKLKMSTVKKSEADFGVTVSPGADRLEVRDEKGKLISPEILLLLFGREILTRKPGSVILYDERFPELIPRKLIDLGGTPIPFNPSEPSIQARLKQDHAELGVLGSGEIVFADRYYGFEDAIYAMCRLLEIMALSENTLSLQVASLTQEPTAAA
jgi:phosphomannomutase/phosphoglucomutase